MKKLSGMIALASTVAAYGIAAPAMAADVRPGVTPVSAQGLAKTLTSGRKGTAKTGDQLVGGSAAAIFLGIAGAGLAGFAIYKAVDNDDPSSN